MSSIDTLILDIERLFDGHSLNDLALDAFAAEIAANFSKRFSRYGTEGQKSLYLSNVGRPFRQLWYQIKSGIPGEPLPANKKLNFLYGDILEDLILLLAVEAGHTVTDVQKEVEVDGIRGRIDAVVDGVLVDVKSASTRSFQKFKDGSLHSQDPFGYIAQLSGYSVALGGIPAAFLVIDKQLGHLCLMKLSEQEIQTYDVRKRIVEARQALDQGEPPVELCYGPPVPDGKSGNLAIPVGCSYCDHKEACYLQQGIRLRKFIYSTGPKWLTHVAREPKVDEFPRRP